MAGDHLGEHPVDRAAPGRGVHRLGPPAVDPRGEERARHPVAHLEPRHAGSHGDDLAGPVREGDEPLPPAVAGAEDREVPPVERHRPHPDEDLALPRRRPRHPPDGERKTALGGFGELVLADIERLAGGERLRAAGKECAASGDTGEGRPERRPRARSPRGSPPSRPRAHSTSGGSTRTRTSTSA